MHDRDQENRFFSFAPAESVEVLEQEREVLALVASQREVDTHNCSRAGNLARRAGHRLTIDNLLGSLTRFGLPNHVMSR